MKERTLQIRFVLEESEALSPSDFVNFFAYGEDVAKDLAETEALELFEYMKVPSEREIESLSTLRRIIRQGPATAEVREIRHDSPWSYLLVIPAGMLVYFASKCLHPEIRRAWIASNGREQFYTFMRDRVFGGAPRKVRDRIAKKSSRKGVRAREVKELDGSSPGAPLLEVRMTRTTIVQLTTSDKELLEDFRRRLRDDVP
jgi:hypothetical protein